MVTDLTGQQCSATRVKVFPQCNFLQCAACCLVSLGLLCTTTSQTDPPPRSHPLGATWRTGHLKLKLSQKVICTAEVVTQSGTIAHLG